MYVLLAILILIALYAAIQSEKTNHNTREIAQTVSELINTLKREPPQHEHTLGYEWYEDGWPFIEDTDGDIVPFKNPIPYYNRDEYSDQLLLSQYQSGVGFEKLSFLRCIRRSASSLPQVLVEELCQNGDVSVRVWFASHGWVGMPRSNSRSETYEMLLENDPEKIVRAALFCNPDYSRLPWQLLGPKEGWREFMARQQPLDRMAMMRNPKLSEGFVVALMKEDSTSIGITREEHAKLIYAAAHNPDLIGSSRRTGRDFWVGGGEGNPPFQEYGEMWRVAYARWLDTIAVYAVFRYIQTTPKIKLEIYNLCAGQDREALRETILGSCEPLKDGEILKLGWNDPSDRCREIAHDRIGSHTRWVGVD